ncbi:MAG TPA: cyclic peptide export ABC transporter, partial [Cytophagales bacterium]
YLASRRTHPYFEQARDARDVFMRLTDGLLAGLKEISLRRNKKLAFSADLTGSAGEYRHKTAAANVRFVNAFLVGELLLVVLLGGVVFVAPEVFPDVKTYLLMKFTVILLYLIGPINAILNAMPAVMQCRVAWNRVQQFLRDIPVAADPGALPVPVSKRVDTFEAAGLRFLYEGEADGEAFGVGPVSFTLNQGEVLFVVGDNGSGKTTLAKLLTGLYAPCAGELRINHTPVPPAQLGEYCSAIFSPCHLFEKMYDVTTAGRAEEIARHLKILRLEEKVKVTGNAFSRIDLSGGQRKRLALLQCYLEDAPIFLFDEWAADQDPAYREFFYRTLLPEMKARGKIVIAITHDDRYFDVADKVLKMDRGKPEWYPSPLAAGAWQPRDEPLAALMANANRS